jgi:two-component system, NarL family, response regulator LiaR
MKMISVFIVEDNEDIMTMLKTIVESNKNYSCVGAAFTGTKALQQIPEILPDIVLMDIGLPDINGIECVKKLKVKCPQTEFMMCTVYDEDEKVFEALKAGANSYILKRSKPELLLRAMEEIMEGGSPMSPDIARKIVRRFHQKANTKEQYHITPKEEEVLNLLSKGHTYEEIAHQLNITVKTLKKHIYNIYEKLHVDNRVEAINKFFGRLNE